MGGFLFLRRSFRHSIPAQAGKQIRHVDEFGEPKEFILENHSDKVTETSVTTAEERNTESVAGASAAESLGPFVLTTELTSSFERIRQLMNEGDRSNYLAGMLLSRLKEDLGHGRFTSAKAHFCEKWGVSDSTLLRRMRFFEDVNKELPDVTHLAKEELQRLAEEETPAARAEVDKAINEAAEKSRKAKQKHGKDKSAQKGSAPNIKYHMAQPKSSRSLSVEFDELTLEERDSLVDDVQCLKTELTPRGFSELFLAFVADLLVGADNESPDEDGLEGEAANG